MAVIPFPSPAGVSLAHIASEVLKSVVGDHPNGIHLNDALDLAAPLMKAVLIDGAKLAFDWPTDALVATLRDGMRLLLTPTEIEALGRFYGEDTTSALTADQVLAVTRGGVIE